MSGAKGPPPGLPGFTFTDSIGGGGFADVFLFTQHSTGRPVAVKVLRAEHLSDASLHQFQVEANVMAGVSAHPYIVTIHDAGVAPDGRPFIVMEHYPQPHFGVRSLGGRLALAEVLKVGVQVSAAVATAHRARIVHRDIKPANILTSAFGDPGLTDFGIAGVQADEGRLTAAGGVSLGFAAPEVVLDEHATGSIQSDVYSLAATIYALLEGRSPVYQPGSDNSPASITRRVANGILVPLRREDIPRSLDHLLHAALAADPTHRPDGAIALGQALQDIEQELRLPATHLVLVGSSAEHAPIDRSHDEDGTRRKPHVVRAEPAPAPTPPSRRDGLPAVGDRAAVDPPTAPPRSGSGVAPEGDTVARARTPPKEPTPPTDPSARPRWVVPAIIGAAALALVLVVAAVTSGGEGEAGTGGAASSTQPTPQDPTGGSSRPGGGALSVNPPTNAKAVLTADGSVELSWRAPTDVDDGDNIRYRVERTDEGHQDEVEDEITATSLTYEHPELNERGGFCFVVSSLLDDVISESPTPEACTGD